MYQLLGFEIRRTTHVIAAGGILELDGEKETAREELRQQFENDLDGYVDCMDSITNSKKSRTEDDTYDD